MSLEMIVSMFCKKHTFSLFQRHCSSQVFWATSASDGCVKWLADFSYVLTSEKLQAETKLASQTNLRSDVVVESGLEEAVVVEVFF